ncbi:MAG: RNA methyltransferase [Acutalibacteraceae bacterium]|nr:RNA methyltransferase [Acutalibacteraceae bacterium]
MSFTEISSKDNGRIKRMIKLQTSSRCRREEGCFVIEGLRTVDDACENSIKLLELYFTSAAYEKHRTELEKFIACADFVAQISESVAKSVSDTFTPQGIFAVAQMPEKCEELGGKGRYIALENVQDPANLGAVARTAEALGISGIILTEDSCDPYSPKSLRASMGTLLRLPLIFTSDMAQFLKKTTASTYACVAHGEADRVGDFSFNSFSVAVIGNEANGLTEKTVAACDRSITIEMKGRAESLNAAAAAAIVMWEMVK